MRSGGEFGNVTIYPAVRRISSSLNNSADRRHSDGCIVQQLHHSMRRVGFVRRTRFSSILIRFLFTVSEQCSYKNIFSEFLSSFQWKLFIPADLLATKLFATYLSIDSEKLEISSGRLITIQKIPISRSNGTENLNKTKTTSEDTEELSLSRECYGASSVFALVMRRDRKLRFIGSFKFQKHRRIERT